MAHQLWGLHLTVSEGPEVQVLEEIHPYMCSIVSYPSTAPRMYNE